MEARMSGDACFLRLDRGDSVFPCLRELCGREHIRGGFFQGIGACGFVTLSTYLPQERTFRDHSLSGMLEMVSLMGSVAVRDDGQIILHAHGIFSYTGEDGTLQTAAGHLKEARIRYTGECILLPSPFPIGQAFDPAAGIDVWKC